MNAATAKLPSFAAPPLEEVAMGVQFNPLPIKLAEIGAYHKLIADHYPTSLDVPPIPPAFETFGAGMLSGIPMITGPRWRVWFVSSDDHHLVQLQPDRLLVNWRMRPASDQPYPRYTPIKERFDAARAALAQFAERYPPGMQANQCELSYFNKIPVPPGATFGDLGQFLRIGGAIEDGAGRRFSGANLALTSILTDQGGQPVGRLAVECSEAIDSAGQQAWALNITVRGRPSGAGTAEVSTFLDRAHIEIVTCFADITTRSMHQKWGAIA